MTDLAELVETIRAAPGLRAKRDLAVVARTLAGLGLDGDDAALVALSGADDDHAPTVAVNEAQPRDPQSHGTRPQQARPCDPRPRDPRPPQARPHSQLVLAGEAIAPALVARDPFAAGAAAVVANVADVRAMGGRPLALVDMLVSPDRGHAERALEGLRWAADRLGVPVAGGHLTLGHPPALSAVCTGTTRAPLRAAAATPGDALLAAFCLDGRYRPDGPFFSSLRDRAPDRLRDDGEALVEVAERGLCHAARDVSMPGVAGSLLQLLELAGCGATLDLDRLPHPHGVPLERWLVTFPSFGFLLAGPPERADEACAIFHQHGLACAVCGSLDASRTLRVAAGGATAQVWDLAADPLTAFGG